MAETSMEAQAIRRTTNFPPSVWKDYFLSHAQQFQQAMDANMVQRHKELEEQVRNMLLQEEANANNLLNLIDQFQRLGVAYHFESEIEKALEKLYNDGHHDKEDDLHALALRFRLLRQHGHNVPCDVFTKFTDKEGNIKESLASDFQGMLSLFEATHLMVHGEELLDKALDFTTKRLRSIMTSTTSSLDEGLASRVAHSLRHPIHKSVTRADTPKNIAFYQQHNLCHDTRLLEYAKIDFNILQNAHQRELANIMRWWAELDFSNKLPFARDRIVELYFWGMSAYFEPQYWLGRKFVTKILYLISYFDDIHDAYGTYDELTLLADAVQRWDLSAIDDLPDYMKVCYRALFNLFREMEEDLANNIGQQYRVSYVEAVMKRQLLTYYTEAKWPHQGYVPTMEEYMEIALVSVGYFATAVTSIAGMDEEFVTKEVLDWVSSFPLVIRAASVVLRLRDDIVGEEFEDRGLPTAVQCYMKQYGASREETCGVFKERVCDAWKDMNQEGMRPTLVARPVIERVVNLARFVDLLYRDKDGYTNPGTATKDLITSILVDPIDI